MNRISSYFARLPLQGRFAVALIAMVTVLLAAPVSIATVALASDTTPKTQAAFKKCGAGSRQACVIDGDTIWFKGQKIRIADIDTPEVGEPKCSSELAPGNRATDRMLELINEGPFEIKAWPGRDADRYAVSAVGSNRSRN